MCSAQGHVRFTPMCGRLRVGKDFFHVCSIGRCAHVFGLCAAHEAAGHNPSADVSINNLYSTMLGGNWVVLIAGSTGSALRAVRPPNVPITPDVRRDLVTPQARRVAYSARPDHHRPGYSGDLVGKRDGGDLRRPPRQQCREPRPTSAPVAIGA